MDAKLKDIISCLSKEMEIFEEKFKENFVSSDNLLGGLLNYENAKKGKRIRPLLIFLIAKTFGQITLQTYRSAIIIELLHTSSLLHDDVIDESLTRRDKRTINSLFGNKIAILVGDYLYGKALATIETKEDFSLMDVFSRIALQLPQGEIKEEETNKDKSIDFEAYMQIIYYKTASLISAATECGARTCGNESVDREKLALLGKNIGMAFQIRDDILDYTPSNKMGKGVGNDIRERKITIPYIYYLNTLSEEKKEESMEEFFALEKTEQEINNIIDKVNKSGAMDKAIELQERYSKAALEIVDSMPLNEYSVALRALVQYLTIRNE
jgi:octaprenyl-diphosphate synthase